MSCLDKLIMLLGCIFEVFLLHDYFHNFFEIKIKNTYIIWFCIGTTGMLFIINLFQNSILNLILVPLLLWIYNLILFEVKLGVRIGYFITAYIVMIGVEFFYIILSETTSEILLQTGLIPVSEYAWQLLLIKFLNFIVFLILKQISTKSNNRITNKLFIIYLFVPLATFGTMITIFYSGIDINAHIILKVIMTLFFVCMIVGNMLLFYAFQKYTENLSENAQQQLEIAYQKAEVERLNEISELHDDINEMIHNYSHYLKVIGYLAYESRNEEICNIVETLNIKLHKKDIYDYCDHKMLNAILTEYSLKAQKIGKSFDVYVEPGCVLEKIKDIDLIAMLGNILDNSFAATKKKEKGSIVVRIFMQKNGRLCIIKVVNDFAEKIREIDGKLLSTKKEAGVHGIGLISISKIAERYDGYLEYYVENEKFNSILVFPVG